MRRLGKRGGLLVIIGLNVLALAVRYAFRNYVNDDVATFVGPWYDHIVQQGGYRVLGQAFSNYSPPYTYLLVLATYLRPVVPKLLAIKGISVAFDFLAAYFMYRLVRLRHPSGPVPWLAYFAVLFAPTVMMNSAWWGQCDAIYSAWLLATVYFVCADRPLASMLSFGVALAFKAQAVFLAPLILILLLKRQLSWRHLLAVPLVYIALGLPSVLLGQPVADMLTVYLRQANFYHSLWKGAPNIWVLIPDAYYNAGVIIGSALAAAAALGMAACALKSKVRLNNELLLTAATLSVALMPFLLPKMHDRYFFPADLLSIGAAFYVRRLRPVPLLFQVASSIAYAPMLLNRELIPVPFGSAVCACAVVGLVVAYVRALYPPRQSARPDPALQHG